MSGSDSSISEVTGAAASPSGRVRAFARELIERYRAAGLADAEAGRASERMAALVLAEAAMRVGRFALAARGRPAQVVVVGPTQVGKSTVVNLLAGTVVAEVSPLAGFTRHAQGVWMAAGDGEASWADELFPGWRRCEAGQLATATLDTYGLTRVQSQRSLFDEPNTGRLPECVLWDTPDFDSLAAGEYQQAVLEAAALADAYVLVLSKEKYSDLSAWRMLRLLEPLGRPLVIVLNKLTPDAADAVVFSLKQRLSQMGRAWGDVAIVPVEYCAELATAEAAGRCAAGGGTFCAAVTSAVAEALGRVGRGEGAQAQGVRALVRRHWNEWTAPVRAEHVALGEWDERVEAGLAEFLERYRRDYLDHPHRYDAFRRAAVELLRLLEVPGLSAWVSKARQVATWPVRRLWQAGREWRAGKASHAHVGAETAVLFDALEALLIGLERDLARRCDPLAPAFPMWRAMAVRLRGQATRLREVFRLAVEAHHAEVERETQAVAGALYEELQRQPGRLAALRGARATLDVGALVLALKTGGLTPVDAIWAPATFALTSLLTEGFAGAQMGVTARGLKGRQYEAVQKTLVERVLRSELRRVGERLEGPGLYGISPEQLAGAEQALDEWER